MNCPVCKTISLVMSERHGIEIDYCPQCRGVWLDRGELDKIIERSAVPPTATPPRHDQQPAPQYDNHGHNPHYQGGYYKKKRESFLSDLFDF